MDNSLERVTKALSGLIYLSESDAPVTCEEWNDVPDLPHLKKKISDAFHFPPELQTVIKTEDFLAEINRTCPPSEPEIRQYIRRWNDLFLLLQNNSKGIAIIKAGTVDLQIFITAFNDGAAMVLHTTATET